MPANKYALLRYRIIDRCLTNKARAFPTKSDLREACEEALYGSDGEHISNSTIEKDLWAMRNESELGYYAPIEYNKEHRGYYYEDEDYSINEISLNDADIRAIRFAAQTLDSFRELPIFNQYENAIDKIVNRIAIAPKKEENQKSVVQFESAPSSGVNQFLEQIYEAIIEKTVLNIHYKKYSSGSERTYTVNPYLLKEYRNRWYLIGKVSERDAVLTFGLDRITQVEMSDSHFPNAVDFDPDNFFVHSIGITQISSNPEIVKIAVDRQQAEYLISQPIHHSQKITSETENEVVFELFVLETFELISFLLSLGKHVKVIEPKSLQKNISKLLRDALDHYQ